MTTIPNDFGRPTTLTPEGQQRRGAILDRLHDELDATRARRAAHRAAARLIAVAAVPAALIAGALIMTSGTATGPIARETALDQPITRITVVRTATVTPVVATLATGAAPAVIARVSAPAPTGVIARINDTELLAGLAAIGRPTGMVQMNGATTLTAAVTDKALAHDG